MHLTNLRKVGGSVMVTIPPAMLDLLQLQAGRPVGVAIDDGKLVIEPHPSPRYTLKQLLAQCDADAVPDPTDQAWIEAPAAGRELL